MHLHNCTNASLMCASHNKATACMGCFAHSHLGKGSPLSHLCLSTEGWEPSACALASAGVSCICQKTSMLPASSLTCAIVPAGRLAPVQSELTLGGCPTGAAYRDWLASATAALRMGVQEFIEKDFSGSFGDVGRLPGLLPLLTRVNPAELLGQHYGRFALQQPPQSMHSTSGWNLLPCPWGIRSACHIVNPAEQLGVHHGRCCI